MRYANSVQSFPHSRNKRLASYGLPGSWSAEAQRGRTETHSPARISAASSGTTR